MGFRDLRVSRPTILVVGGDPRGGDARESGELALEQEFTAIERELLMAPHRDFKAIFARAATIDDLMRHLNRRALLIIHIAGHGVAYDPLARRSLAGSRDIAVPSCNRAGGLYLLDGQGQPQLVTLQDLATMIRSAAPSARMVVLNACHSDSQAETLCDVVDCVITIAGAIGDTAAQVFSAALYRAIGNRRSVGNAFSQAVAALDVKRFPDKDLPKCRTRSGVKPEQIFLSHPPKSQLCETLAFDTGWRHRFTQRQVRPGRLTCVLVALSIIAAAATRWVMLQDTRQPADARWAPVAAPKPVAAASDGIGPTHVPNTDARQLSTSSPSAMSEPKIQPRKPAYRTREPAHGTREIPRLPQAPPLKSTRAGPQRDEPPSHSSAPTPPGMARGGDRTDPAVTDRVAPLLVLGDLDPTTVRRYVDRYHDRIKHCYDNQLLARPTLAGTVTAKFLITPEGRVASSTASGMDDAVARCVAGVIKDIEFPRSGSNLGGAIRFDFVPSGH